MSRAARKVSFLVHWFQFNVEWGTDNPEFFDHQLDLHYQWTRTGNSLPMERGVHSSMALVGGGNTLDLACGDGFFTNYFYALRSKSVVGVDFDPVAIRQAKKNVILSNVNFILGDIRKDIPDGPFDNIVWDAAIEHFTETEIKALVARIKEVMAPEGILSGYTVTEAEHGHKHLHQHEYEFHDKEDLLRFFEPHFRNVHVYETVFPNRTNLYFYATDGKLPLRSDRHLILER
ncbi:class I SAM-dependent methyltransferase [Aquiluna borgnonia]|nr:class I SAM-dependent methyltransferase [Aquiluna borgnonia]